MSYSIVTAGNTAPDADENSAKTMECLLETQDNYLKCQLLLHEQIRISATLEQELATHNEWEHERRKYSLHEITSGVVVMKFLEKGPVHYLCPDCFWNQREKRFLQEERGNDYRQCGHCRKTYRFKASETAKMKGGQS